MKSLYNYLTFIVLLTVFLFGNHNANAQTTDTTNVFDPALTGTEIVYTALTYVDVDNDGNFDTSFALSDTPISSWGDYATSFCFYNDRISLRVNGTFIPADSLDYVIVPEPGKLYHCWVELDVTNLKYYVYVQGGDMAQPENIYTRGGDFRKQSTFIDRWSALHNPGNEPDYLNVAHVQTTDAIGTIPQVVIDGMSDPSLKSLTTSVGELNPEFDPFETDYEIAVPFGTTEIQLDAVPNGLGASVSMFDGAGAEIENGLVNFAGDGIDVEVIVTTLNGIEADYYVALFVDEGQDDPSLKAIETSAGAIEPVFMPETTEYTLIVPKGTTSVDITGVPNYPQATVEGDGTINLTNGAGSATVVVTSFDESATRTYTINIEETDGTNYALYLPGEDGNMSNVDISGLDLNTLPITIEMWFKPEGTQPYNAGLIFNRPSNVGIQYASSWWSSAHAIRFMVNGTDTGAQYSENTTASPATPDMWHHIAVILDDSTRMMYLDGKPYIENASFSPIDWSTGSLYLGWDMDNSGKAFKGAIDEVRIWSDSLTAEELENNRLNILTGNEENLVAYYNFDIPSSAYAVDFSSNAHNGIISGGSYIPSFSRADVDLDTLSITEGKLTPEFSPRLTKYHVTFPYGTTSFDIDASVNNSGVTITGTGTVTITEAADSAVVRVTEDASGEYKEYIIYYVVDTELELKHSYTFADGTAKDVVSGADGVVNGGTIEDGAFTSSEDGDYITLPATDIALNEFPSFTIEAYVTNGFNDGYSMLTYFGDLNGANSTWIQLTRPTDVSRVELSTGATDALTGQEPAMGENKHYVFTANSDSLTWYIDGFPIDTVKVSDGNVISGISTANAWIGKSGWNDPTYLGTIYELNIYSGTMPESEVQFRYLSFPIEDSTSDATLAEVLIDEVPLNGFAPYTMVHDTIFDITPESVPVVTATATNTKSTVTVTNATEFPGTATIEVTSEDGNHSNVYTINLKSKVNAKIHKESNIKVYPTKSTSNFVVETTGGNCEISVFSLTGRLISRSNSIASKTKISVPSKGMYLIRVENNDEIKSFKVIRY